MSRVVSTTLREALAAPETGETPIALVTFTHADLAAPLRLTDNSEDVTSRGLVYAASTVRVQLPDESEDRPPRGRLVTENISREIVQSLRAIEGLVMVTTEIVLASDPDTVEVSWPDFFVSVASWDALEVSADISQEPFLDAAYPDPDFTPSGFPGLFP